MKAIIILSLVLAGTMYGQFFGGGNASRLRGIPIASLSGCTTGQQITFNGTSFVCDAAGAGTGITSLEGQTGATQTFTDDTNVTIVSGSNAHVITWAGTLALTRGGTGASTASGARTNLGLGWAGGFDLVLTSSTVLDIAAGYAVKGSTATSIAADTITWATGASGSIAFYIDYTSTPALGCAVTSITVTGITCVASGSEPANRVPLYSVTVTSSQFQAGWSDFRTGVIASPVTSGTGVIITSGVAAIDTTLVTQKFVTAGAPTNVTGSTRGDLVYDSTNVNAYMCKNATTCAVGGDWLQLNGGGGTTGSALLRGNGAGGFDNIDNSTEPNAGEIAISTTPGASATRAVIGLGSAPAGGSTSGSYLMVNAPSGFSGHVLAVVDNGTRRWSVDKFGGIEWTAGGSINASEVRFGNGGATNRVSAYNTAQHMLLNAGDVACGNTQEVQLATGDVFAPVPSLRMVCDGRITMGQTAPTPATTGDLDLVIKDNTATTGVTVVEVIAGAGQSATDLMRWNSNGGTIGVRVAAEGALVNLPFGTKPTCGSGFRGMFWHVQGGAGVKDDVQVCAKDAGDAYAWRTIY